LEFDLLQNHHQSHPCRLHESIETEKQTEFVKRFTESRDRVIEDKEFKVSYGSNV